MDLSASQRLGFAKQDASFEAVGQRDPWTIKSSRALDRWPELNAAHPNHDLVREVENYQYELGSATVTGIASDWRLEDPETFIAYYKEYLHSKEHTIYLAMTEATGPIFVLIEDPDDSVKKFHARKVLILCAKEEEERLLVPSVGKVSTKELVRKLRPSFADITFKRIAAGAVTTEILDMEAKRIVTNYKFGVLYQKAGQTTEDQWYNNVETSSEFESFLSFLGERIELKNWAKFRGGLDVTLDKTGTHSIYTEFRDLEIMFHVATMIPYFPADPQQVERKRHLGNDVVIVVFRDADCDVPFDPTQVKSQFNRIAPTQVGMVWFDTLCFGPPLPENTSLSRNDTLRNFLLTKLINGERAAMHAPDFKARMANTRKMILTDIYDRYSKATQSDSFAAKLSHSVTHLPSRMVSSGGTETESGEKSARKLLFRSATISAKKETSNEDHAALKRTKSVKIEKNAEKAQRKEEKRLERERREEEKQRREDEKERDKEKERALFSLISPRGTLQTSNKKNKFSTADAAEGRTHLGSYISPRDRESKSNPESPRSAESSDTEAAPLSLSMRSISVERDDKKDKKEKAKEKKEAREREKEALKAMKAQKEKDKREAKEKARVKHS